MAKRTVEESSLTMVADAIREGSGTTGDMEFPGEFQERAKSMANAVKFTEQTLTEEQKAQARANIGVGAPSGIEPAEDDIPKVFFGDALPQTKTDMVMSFRYISKTEDIKGYCKTKAQGNSSMSYPKKNQTVKLYKDAECTEKLKVDFKGWGKQSKFCFKANWIDLTHARNIVSARLWGDMVKSRSNYAAIPELLRTSPNQGAIDGFPVKVYANGVYQGRYTINIPKDAWMANMDDELDTHCILCGENYVSGCFRAEANIDESDWTDEIHDTVPDAIKTRWNEAINFVMNSTDNEFVAGIGNYFDVPSLIDYYLFGVVSCGLDAFGKNQLYMTYDGMKWYATMYDMDSTWGLWWDGSRFVGADYSRDEFQDFKDGNGNLLYIRLANLFEEAIEQRRSALTSGALSIHNIINRFERFTDIAPPHLVMEDCAETTAEGNYSGIPLQAENNIQQIREFVRKRIIYSEENNRKIVWREGLFLMGSDGKEYAGDNNWVCNFVPLDGADKIAIFIHANYDNNTRLHFYNSNMETTGYIGQHENYDVDGKLAVIADSEYVKFSVSSQQALDSFEYITNKNWNGFREADPSAFVESRCPSESGEIDKAAYGYFNRSIPVIAGQYFYTFNRYRWDYTGAESVQYHTQLYCFDDSGAFVSAIEPVRKGTNGAAVFIVPDGVTNVKVGAHNAAKALILYKR